MKRVIAIWLALVSTGWAALDFTATIDYAYESVPTYTVYQASERSWVWTVRNYSATQDITGQTPFMYWATSNSAGSVVTARCAIVVATSGTFRATFTPTDLNYTGRVVYGVGLRGTNGNAVVARQGALVIVADPYASGVGAITWTTNVDWNTITWLNLPGFVSSNLFGDGFSWDGTHWLAGVSTSTVDATARAWIVAASNSLLSGVTTAQARADSAYVAGTTAQASADARVSKAGDTMTGALTNEIGITIGTESNQGRVTLKYRTETMDIWIDAEYGLQLGTLGGEPTYTLIGLDGGIPTERMTNAFAAGYTTPAWSGGAITSLTANPAWAGTNITITGDGKINAAGSAGGGNLTATNTPTAGQMLYADGTDNDTLYWAAAPSGTMDYDAVEGASNLALAAYALASNATIAAGAAGAGVTNNAEAIAGLGEDVTNRWTAGYTLPAWDGGALTNVTGSGGSTSTVGNVDLTQYAALVDTSYGFIYSNELAVSFLLRVTNGTRTGIKLYSTANVTNWMSQNGVSTMSNLISSCNHLHFDHTNDMLHVEFESDGWARLSLEGDKDGNTSGGSFLSWDTKAGDHFNSVLAGTNTSRLQFRSNYNTLSPSTSGELVLELRTNQVYAPRLASRTVDVERINIQYDLSTGTNYGVLYSTLWTSPTELLTQWTNWLANGGTQLATNEYAGPLPMMTGTTALAVWITPATNVVGVELRAIE